jgi:hypothetical protein
MNPASTNATSHPIQFSIAAVLEYTAICGALAAFARGSGIVSCAFLMAMALSLGAKQGGLAVAMLIAASQSTELPATVLDNDSTGSRQLIVFLLAASLCVWYRVRRPAVTHIPRAFHRIDDFTPTGSNTASSGLKKGTDSEPTARVVAG